MSDDRLELIFTCCHPALSAEASVALTLRLVAGLTTAEIARAFLVPEPAMAQRLVRAKAKIRHGRDPVPAAARATCWPIGSSTPRRCSTWSSTRATRPRPATISCAATCATSRSGSRGCVVEQLPAEPEPRGLLALMLLHHARAAARTTASGELVLLEHQDRARWDAGMIRSGSAELRRAERAGAPGPYQLQAAIAELHARAPSFEATDWARVAELYAELAEVAPSPVIDLNHAAAVSMAEGPAARPRPRRRARRRGGARPLPPAARRPGRHAAPARTARPTRSPPTRGRSSWPRPRPSASSSSAAAPRCSARCSEPPNGVRPLLAGRRPARRSVFSAAWRARSRRWAGSWARRRCMRWPTARSPRRSTTRSASRRSMPSR